MPEKCSTCLSSDRLLIPLVSLKPVLDSLIRLQHGLPVEPVHVCSECQAELANVHRFQQQALRAQRALAQQQKMGRPNLESLSTLSTMTCSDEFEEYEEVVHHETDDYDSCDHLNEDLVKDEQEESDEETFEENEHNEKKIVSDEDNFILDLNEDLRKVKVEEIDGNKIFISASKQENEHVEKKIDSDEDEQPSKQTPRNNKKGSNEALDIFHHLIKDAEKFVVEQNNALIKLTNHTDEITDKKDSNEAFDTFLSLVKDADKFVVEQKIALIELKKFTDENAETNVPQVEDKMDSNEEEELFIHLTYQEKQFILTRMTLEEVQKIRDMVSSSKRYTSSQFKCETCLKVYTTKEKLDVHKASFHMSKVGRNKCSVCLSRFPRLFMLREHYEAHFKLYRCRECEYTDHRLHYMMLHANAEHTYLHLPTEIPAYTCEFCGINYPQKKRLIAHIELWHEERAEECKKCKENFTTKYDLKLHNKKFHYKGAREKCPQCGKMYRSLRNHLKYTHGARGSEVEGAYCAECDRQYCNVNSYRIHLQKHTRHRKPEALKCPCPHCEKKFMTDKNLAKHVASVHTRAFAFKCNSCDRRFNHDSHLRAHYMKRHLGLTPPKNKICNICGRGFTDQHILTNHIRTHTGEKPFACAHCGRAFAQKVALTSHIRNIHLKQKRDANEH